MNISKATTEDIPQLETLVNSAYRGESSKKGWTTEADLLGGQRTNQNLLTQMMTKQNALFLKYCNEENIIEGCVFLEKKENKIYLGMLTVSPLLQNKGIGKKLLFAAEDYAKHQNCSSVEMTVISVRSEIIEWYKRHCYFETGETRPFPADPEFGLPRQPLEFIVLEKLL